MQLNMVIMDYLRNSAIAIFTVKYHLKNFLLQKILTN